MVSFSESSMKYLSVNIRSLRQDHRLSLEALAALAGCSKSLLSKIETGKIVPTLATLARIAEALGTDAGSLLQKSTEEKMVFNEAMDPFSHLLQSDKGYQFFPFALKFAN